MQNERAARLIQVQSKGKERTTSLPLWLMPPLHLRVVVGNFLCVSDMVSILLQRYVHFNVINVLEIGKCNQCLNIGQEQFEKILDCKELTRLCSGCSKEVMESDRVKKRDDRLVEMMSALLQKVTGMELGLSQKADIGVVQELEERVKALEEKFETECRKKRGKKW